MISIGRKRRRTWLGQRSSPPSPKPPTRSTTTWPTSSKCAGNSGCPSADPDEPADEQLDTLWRKQPVRVRILGFGPDFDSGAYEQNGHIRIDFGLDTPWTFGDQPFGERDEDGEEAAPLDAEAANYIRQNVEKLLAFTLSVEKHCNISSRLLWTESGEPLAEKLVARLQRLN